MADAEVRQRKSGASKASTGQPSASSSTTKRKDEDSSSVLLDVLRVLTFLLVASCGLSYVISGGESFTWSMATKPNYLKVDWWKAQLSGPIHLTVNELAAYDGTDPEKPIYLGLNGTIYDVSAGRRMYGPGAPYHAFAGADAARGFITGCYKADRTADLRGVEEAFLPLDDPEVDKYWTTKEMEELREQELAAAKQRAFDALHHWVEFFANSKKYTKVGYVKRSENWTDGLPVPTLCPEAQKNRKRRQPKS